jgi:ferredoxin-thioredoxin reductase catalytic chain
MSERVDDISEQEIYSLTRRLDREAESSGYHLNPDMEFTRDPDLNDFDSCYCALYVSQAVLAGKKVPGPIPERRPPEKKSGKSEPAPKIRSSGSLQYPVWRCRVCGYLCAREGPPEVCPICKAKKDRFETFLS